jgi:hypothetical protein
MLETITIRVRDAWMPYAGAAFGAAILGLFWDPAELDGLGARLLLCLAVVVAYGFGLWASGHPEVRTWVRRSLGAGI